MPVILARVWFSDSVYNEFWKCDCHGFGCRSAVVAVRSWLRYVIILLDGLRLKLNLKHFAVEVIVDLHADRACSYTNLWLRRQNSIILLKVMSFGSTSRCSVSWKWQSIRNWVGISSPCKQRHTWEYLNFSLYLWSFCNSSVDHPGCWGLDDWPALGHVCWCVWGGLCGRGCVIGHLPLHLDLQLVILRQPVWYWWLRSFYLVFWSVLCLWICEVCCSGIV